MRDSVTTRPADYADMDRVISLLRRAGLPTSGLADQFGKAYVVAERGGRRAVDRAGLSAD